MSVVLELYGAWELKRAIQSLQRQGGSVAKTAISKAMPVLVKGIKDQVSKKFSDIKKIVGWSNKKARRSDANTRAKVGFGVGYKPKDKKGVLTRKSEFFREKRVARSGSGRGVGAGPNNVHWFTMGTGRRKTKATKANRGRMRADPQMAVAVRRGIAAKKSEAMAKLKAGASLALERAAARAAKRAMGPQIPLPQNYDL